MYHVIHQSHVRLFCCESVGNCQTLSKDRPSQLVNSIIFRPFFLFFASDVHCFLPILSRSDVCPPRVLHIVFVFINRQLFISRDIQWHVTVFSVFFVKVKVELVSLSANFDYLGQQWGYSTRWENSTFFNYTSIISYIYCVRKRSIGLI